MSSSFQQLLDHMKENYPSYRVRFAAFRYMTLLNIIIYLGMVNMSSNPIDIKDNIQVGLSQPNRCNFQSDYYHVVARPLDDTITHNASITNPIFYNGDNYVCIDNDHLKSCDALLTNSMFQLSEENFTELFEIPEHEYFPHLTTIMFTCLISIYLISTTNVSTDRATERRIAYFSEFLGIILIVTMFMSASQSQLKFDEDCYHTLGSDEYHHNICSSLTQCGLTISSLANVQGTMAEGYVSTMYVIGVLWSAYDLFHLLVFLMYDYHTILSIRFEMEHQSILSKQGDELLQALENVSEPFINHYIGKWKYIYDLNSTRDIHLSNSSNGSTVSAQPSGTTGAVYSPLSPSPEHSASASAYGMDSVDNTCSICLSCLFSEDICVPTTTTTTTTTTAISNNNNTTISGGNNMGTSNKHLSISPPLDNSLLSTAATYNTNQSVTLSNTQTSSVGLHNVPLDDIESAYKNDMTNEHTTSYRNQGVRSSTILDIDVTSASSSTGRHISNTPSLYNRVTNYFNRHRSAYTPLNSNDYSGGLNSPVPHGHDGAMSPRANSTNMPTTCTTSTQMRQSTTALTTSNNVPYTANTETTVMKKIIQLQCHHLFHQVCILQWATVSTNTVCPVCRHTLK